MSRYRKVEIGMWHDRKFRELTPAPPSGQTLWMYLLTGQRTTVFPGLVVATLPVIADDRGWPLEDARACWNEIEARGMALADWTAGVIVLPRALRTRAGVPRETSRPSSPNAFRGWAKAWGDIPDCLFKDAYLCELQRFAKALGQAYVDAFGEAFPAPTEEVSFYVSQTALRPARVPDPVPDPVPSGDPGTPPSQPPADVGADRDPAPAIDRGAARAAGFKVPPPSSVVHERVAPPPPPPPAPGAVAADPDVRARQRLVERFRQMVASIRAEAAEKHGLKGVRAEIPLHGGENETELRARIKDAGPRAFSELEHVLAVARAEALLKPESVQWLGWSLGRSRSWNRALQTTPELVARGGRTDDESVFTAIDRAADKLRDQQKDGDDDDH